MIGQIADRIQGFLGGARGDNDLFSLHGLVHIGDLALDPLAEDLGLRQFPASGIPAGEIAAGGIDDGKAILSEQGNIVLCDWIFQHCRIHGRRHKLFALSGKNDSREHIVGDAVGHLGDHVRCRRRNEDDIRLFCDRNMAHIKLKLPVKGIDHAF